MSLCEPATLLRPKALGSMRLVLTSSRIAMNDKPSRNKIWYAFDDRITVGKTPTWVGATQVLLMETARLPICFLSVRRKRRQKFFIFIVPFFAFRHCDCPCHSFLHQPRTAAKAIQLVWTGRFFHSLLATSLWKCSTILNNTIHLTLTFILILEICDSNVTYINQ